MRLNHNPEKNDINENKEKMMNHMKILTTGVRERWHALIHEGGINIYVALLYLIIL